MNIPPRKDYYRPQPVFIRYEIPLPPIPMQIHKTIGSDLISVVEESVALDEAGLTKREWFAGLALQGLLADSEVVGEALGIACTAVKMADALIEALNGSHPVFTPYAEAAKTGLTRQD